MVSKNIYSEDINSSFAGSVLKLGGGRMVEGRFYAGEVRRPEPERVIVFDLFSALTKRKKRRNEQVLVCKCIATEDPEFKTGTFKLIIEDEEEYAKFRKENGIKEKDEIKGNELFAGKETFECLFKIMAAGRARLECLRLRKEATIIAIKNIDKDGILMEDSFCLVGVPEVYSTSLAKNIVAEYGNKLAFILNEEFIIDNNKYVISARSIVESVLNTGVKPMFMNRIDVIANAFIAYHYSDNDSRVSMEFNTIIKRAKEMLARYIEDTLAEENTLVPAYNEEENIPASAEVEENISVSAKRDEHLDYVAKTDLYIGGEAWKCKLEGGIISGYKRNDKSEIILLMKDGSEMQQENTFPSKKAMAKSIF